MTTANEARAEALARRIADFRDRPDRPTSREIADALIADGYRKPEAAPSDTDKDERITELEARHFRQAQTIGEFQTATGHRSGPEFLTARLASQPVQVEATDDTFDRMMSNLDRLGGETIVALIAELNEVDADIRGELGTDVASRAAATLSAALGTPAQPVQVEVTAEWEYGHFNGDYITIPPAGIPHTHRRIKAVPAGPWEEVPAALGGGDQ